MSKRKRHDRSAITATKPLLTASGPAPSETPPGGATRWAIFSVAVLVLLAGWGAFVAHSMSVWPFESSESPRPAKEPVWKAPAWQAKTDDDRLIDRYMQLRSTNDPAASALLAEPTGQEPLDEAGFERRAAGHFLRDGTVKIVEAWKGEPGKDGKPLAAARRYTFVTQGQAAMPHVNVRDETGRVSPTALSMVNPDIIVEVKDGKIHPLRTEMHKAP